jgi:putative addiction module killer protein
MFTVVTTEAFDTWFAALRDNKAKARIESRLTRVELGNLGDTKPVGVRVSEMRIDYGPGYRLPGVACR